MPQEDEVTSYVSCTSGTANSVSESDNESVEKGFKKMKFVKAGNMQQEVSKIEKISNKDFIENKIFAEADVYEQESEDPFIKKHFVKQSQHHNVKGKSNHFQENIYPHQHARTFVHKVDNSRKVLKSKMLVKNDVSRNSQRHGSDSPSIKKFFKKNVVSQQVSRVKENVSQRQVPIQSKIMFQLKLFNNLKRSCQNLREDEGTNSFRNCCYSPIHQRI
ncbi:hypothetical protein L1987_15480 [Smallanthus sonchifolius]|uniref:Uncharacterized protein n=1 Tax=Smallanthus sonchifolius TaxID=185202 RepID=A0ACB9J5R0_9ASTR|nr:hypothetical protein L1987_15480 [Smallanthus sonchifolius]